MESVALRSGLAKSSPKEWRNPVPEAKLDRSKPCIPAGRQAVTDGSLGTIFLSASAPDQPETAFGLSMDSLAASWMGRKLAKFHRQILQ